MTDPNANGRHKPFDLDAIEAEAEGRRFEFNYHGRTWSLPPLDAVDKSLISSPTAAPDQLALEAFRQALGDQWEDFDAVPMSLRSLNALLEEWSRFSGVELGEGLASTRS